MSFPVAAPIPGPGQSMCERRTSGIGCFSASLYLRGGVNPCPRSTVVETPPALIPLNAGQTLDVLPLLRVDNCDLHHITK